MDENRLPPKSIRHLLITAEHAGFQYRGGIGSYAQEMENLLGGDRLGVFFVGEKEYSPAKFPSEQFLGRKRWIVPSLIVGQDQCAFLPKEDLVYLCFKRILPLYPRLETVEIQDCDGWGVRIAQAKRAGLVPDSLTVKIRCHGTYVYLEQAHGKWWADQYHLRLMAREKQAIEQADCVSFPTDFLRDLYQQSGYSISPDRVEKLRYPLALPTAQEPVEFRRADSLIFVGARTSMKGFPVFVEALKKLLAGPAGGAVRQIYILGSTDPAMAWENAYIKALGKRLKVREAALPRRKLLKTQSILRGRAVCVLPYLGDNHPNAVLEAMACGCPMIAADRGGIPELIPANYHDQCLCPPDPDSLAESMTRLLTMKPKERQALAEGLRREYLTTQQTINQAHWRTESPAKTAPALKAKPRETVLLVLTESPEDELLQALEEQIRKPDQTLFIPKESFGKALQSLQEENKEGILAILDADYLPEPEFIQTHARYLEQNPGTGAVSAYCREQGGRVIRPLGDGLLLNMAEDCLGHGGAAFSLSHLREADLLSRDRIKAPEDLFPALLGAGGKIGVIPEVLSQRKARPNADRDFTRGLALGFLADNLPRFEALRLAGIMQDYAAMQQTPAIAIARELENYPFLLRLGRAALEKAARIYFRIKSHKDA
ncbi:glycosyltransferase [Desulfatibacillum aliphaticivorans]|uniref:glycosyltransferase n=1 Tax=Desulfatibacillum aliphaticivorans TaxID=218208 RepID=UPI0012F874E1|nr:glycosyltransferase [Desulfatibacillum aliphaticivorans]